MDYPSIKELVKDNMVYFSYYRKDYLYYQIKLNNDTYSFPVPIEDTGDGTFLAQDKALQFMRYIRKSQQDGTFIKINN